VNWHAQTFGECPHGFAAAPYCARCLLDRRKAAAEADAARRAEKAAKERDQLREQVEAQRRTIDAMLAQRRADVRRAAEGRRGRSR
jgi:hypothetical protein